MNYDLTIKEIKNQSIKKLLEKNIDIYSANLDVDILLSFITKIAREFILSNDKKILSKDEYCHYQNLFERRFNDEPIAYIIEKKEFYGHSFKVNKNVLIPRPETEELIDIVINNISSNSNIVDIGSGSGCIAIILKHLIATYNMAAIDISSYAIDVAKENALSILGNSSLIKFINADALNYTPDKKFDVIVSNPPYIAKSDINILSNDVKNYEPSIALFSGDSGYEFYEKIHNRLDILLTEKGKFFFEIGYNQELNLRKIFHDKYVSFIKDLSGHSRFMIGAI